MAILPSFVRQPFGVHFRSTCTMALVDSLHSVPTVVRALFQTNAPSSPFVRPSTVNPPHPCASLLIPCNATSVSKTTAKRRSNLFVFPFVRDAVNFEKSKGRRAMTLSRAHLEGTVVRAIASNVLGQAHGQRGMRLESGPPWRWTE